MDDLVQRRTVAAWPVTGVLAGVLTKGSNIVVLVVDLHRFDCIISINGHPLFLPILLQEHHGDEGVSVHPIPLYLLASMYAPM
jgi:hypothetical protein